MTLGVDELFTPIDNEIFIVKLTDRLLIISLKMVVVLQQNVTKSQESKLNLYGLRHDIKSNTNGMNAEYFLADAWFATKRILKMTVEQSLEK